MSAPIIKKNKIEQTIDLKKEFGVDFTGARAVKESIAQAIIDKIVSRTKSGRGMKFNGEKGKEVKLKSPYSKMYAGSQDFKAFGKKKSKVNLTLTGDMLESIDIKSIKGNELVIGIVERVEKKKAYAHSTGKENDSKLKMPQRPFFGVNSKELTAIKNKFSSEIKSALRAKQEEGKSAFEAAVLGLLDRINKDGKS